MELDLRCPSPRSDRGIQEIGAQSFNLTRTVSTGSWVALEHQRAGYGKSMREAVLWFAFAILGWERVDSAAWNSNEASLHVSRALGYQANGTTTRAADGRRVEQVNLTLSRSDWTDPPEGFTALGMTADARTLLGCPEVPQPKDTPISRHHSDGG
jgi:RimJ/RimL family protein N-acetyltransferase